MALHTWAYGDVLNATDLNGNFSLLNSLIGSGFVWRGAWDVATPYAVADVVSYGGSSWRAIEGSTGVTPVEGAYWTLVSAKGDAGATGGQWFSGSGVPSDGTGANGDFYLRTNGDVYQKAAGTWGSPVTNILGPTGPAGPTGGVWYTGSGAPSDGVGANGDMYLRSNGLVYQKAAGAWGSSLFSLMGATGAAGAAGAAGADGATWHTSVGVPSDGTGADGDYNLRTSNGEIYLKVGGVWVDQSFSIMGATGPGVATGGSAGQVLAKIDGTNYNTEWVDNTAGSVTDVTAGVPLVATSPTGSTRKVAIETANAPNQVLASATSSAELALGAATYKVSGAGDTDSNSSYHYAGTYNSHPYYVKAGSPARFLFFDGGGAAWAIALTLGGSLIYYNGSGATPDLDPWTAASGAPPAPTVVLEYAGDQYRPRLLVPDDIPELAESKITNLTTDLGAKLATANNLSELTGTAATARTNLGLGTIATAAAPSGTVVGTSDTQTLTNKRITRRVSSAANYTTSVTPNADTTDMLIATAQAGDLLINAPSGTPTDGQTLWFAFTGTAARALSWDAAGFEASDTASPPVTTVSTHRIDVGFVWNVASGKWRCVAVA